MHRRSEWPITIIDIEGIYYKTNILQDQISRGQDRYHYNGLHNGPLRCLA
jgi:hypothetical protein